MLDLEAADRDAQIRFESIEHITNEAHARTAIAVLRAFGESSIGFIYAEARTPDHDPSKNARPSDILILHPEIGALLIEVKGWVIHEITNIEAGTFYRHVSGRNKIDNPWKQAQDAAGQLQTAAEKIIFRRRRQKGERAPFFEWVVALPNIARTDWEQRNFHKAIHESEVLLADDLHDPAALRSKLIQHISAKSGKKNEFSRAQLDLVREALGSTEIINRLRKLCSSAAPDTLGSKINRLELEHKRLSREQIEFSDREFDGRPQLIRGVAGSGKSIVLVKNLVNMIDRYENSGQLSLLPSGIKKRFAIVCFNRTLVPFLQRKFEQAYQELTHQKPTQQVDIFHFQKFMWNLSAGSTSTSTHGGPLQYQDLNQWSPSGKQLKNAQQYISQLSNLAANQPELLSSIQYDAIYIDEGQDLLEEEYLCLMYLLRSDSTTSEKNIVIFYDDAQNLYGRPRPTWSKLGIQISGGRTDVMRTCFRNTKQIIEFAFNLLLGTKAETRVTTRQFADLAYLREKNLVEELEDRWCVNFAERADGEYPDVVLLNSRDEEKLWIESKIKELIEREAVRVEDILLIAYQPEEYRVWVDTLPGKFDAIKRIRKPFGKSTNTEKDEYIFAEGEIVLASVEAAKGYDAPIVFVLGADLFPITTEGRAHFYVAASRAKFHLIVTGIDAPSTLAAESKFVSELLRTPPKALHLPQLQASAAPGQPEPADQPEVQAIDRVHSSSKDAGVVIPRVTPHQPANPSPGVLPRSAKQPAVVMPSASIPSKLKYQIATEQTAFLKGDRVHHPTHGGGIILQDFDPAISSDEQRKKGVYVTLFTGVTLKFRDKDLLKLRAIQN